MREIKFRVLFDKLKVMQIYTIEELLTVFDYESAKIDGVRFMQYTGLKDENGVEVYEGDIIKRGDGMASMNSTVVYQNSGFVIDNRSLFYASSHSVFRVVGNIYEATMPLKSECDYCNERNMPLWWNAAGHPLESFLEPNFCPMCGKELKK